MSEKKRGRPKTGRPELAPIGIRLEPDNLAALKAHGEKIDRPAAWVIRQALREYLERHAGDAPPK